MDLQNLGIETEITTVKLQPFKPFKPFKPSDPVERLERFELFEQLERMKLPVDQSPTIDQLAIAPSLPHRV